MIEEEGIQANSADVGTYFILELEKLRQEFEVVGDVRGKGLMIGLELVKDKVTGIFSYIEKKKEKLRNLT